MFRGFWFHQKKTKELLKSTLKKIPFRAGLLNMDGNKKTKSKNFEIFVKTLNFNYYLVNILLHINVKLIKVVVVQYL